MPIIAQFSPPGHADDLTSENKALWSEFLSDKYFARSKAGSPDDNDGPRTQFFNPTTDDIPGDLIEAVITWTAFPRQVANSSASDRQRWTKADSSRTLQDEYCEWSVHRDSEGKILWVDFTSEGPEYWQVMAQLQPDTLLALYQKHVSPNVDHDDLFPAGRYEPMNRWNNSTKNGAMHLIQRANTLGAEIELAAGASIVRRRDGEILTKVQDLIRCSQYGAPERHSDPHIGSEINKLARGGHLVSLADPVGLFIQGCDFSGFELPTAAVKPSDCWRIVRGTESRALRVRFAPPVGTTFTVSDITIDGNPIEFGGQIADKISIGLAGWASPDTGHVQIVEGCRGAGGGGLLLAATATPSGFSTRRF